MVSRAEILKTPPGEQVCQDGWLPWGSGVLSDAAAQVCFWGMLGPSSEYLVSLGSPLLPEKGSQIISGV